MEKMETNRELIKKTREKVSQEVLNYLVRITDRVEKTGARIAEQLEEVCMELEPLPTEDAGANKAEAMVGYPPYFNTLREQIQLIESALAKINDVLDRCEV